MRGVPKSRGCQICKRRKVKCDETWPSCKQCRQYKFKCPGPTSLIRFIHNNFDNDTASTNGLDAISVPDQSQSIQVFGSNLESSLLQMRGALHFANLKEDDHAVYGRLQLGVPRSNPTTLADRVSVRLITSLEKGPAGVTDTYMSYLPELPKRLSESACLRDSVDLFCTAWAHLRHHRETKGQLIGMPQYGKALRSLRRALMGEQARRIETLAAMTLLERTSRLFDRPENADIHVTGIREVFIEKKMPDLQDELEVAITHEVHALLLRDWTGGADISFVNKSPWKEALGLCADEKGAPAKVYPFVMSDILVIYGCSKKLSTLFSNFQKIRRDPESPGMEKLAESVRQTLRGMKDSGREVSAHSLERGLEDGAIREARNSAAILGTKYHFKSVLLAGLYQAMLMCQLIPLRMLHHLDVLSGSVDSSIFEESREASEEVWKMIPSIQSFDPNVAINMLNASCVSYELAGDREKDYILDSILQIDSVLGRFPTDRESLSEMVRERGRLLTGRRKLA